MNSKVSHSMTKVPTYDQLMNPLITALRELGGSGSVDEIYERVLQDLRLPEDALSVLHDPEAGNQTEVSYRLAWARSYLKKFGAVTNSSRGVWALSKPDQASVEPENSGRRGEGEIQEKQTGQDESRPRTRGRGGGCSRRG